MSQPKDVDPMIDGLSDAIKPTLDKIQESTNRALLVFAVAHDDDPMSEAMQMYVAVAGPDDLIADGLYNELADQLSNGNSDVFLLFRRVIRDLEKDYDLTPDEEPRKRSSLH